MKALSNCLRLLAIAVAIVTFGSCSDENDYYWSPLIGDWVLVADEYGPVDTDQNIFSFYGDGSGQYVDYDTGGSHIPTTSIGIPMERLSTSRLPTDRTGCISGLSTATICILPMSIPEVSWCLPCIERQPRPLM